MCPYGPVWARVGPARALEEREKLGKTCFSSNTVLRKDIVFDLQTTFFDGFNMLLSFLAEK